jgi:GH25 family lysozyme M1 (1,4-beta-N-acetylmuramidase)
MIRGIDVSEWQGGIDWSSVKSAVDFAIIRASYGAIRPDWFAALNRDRAREVGILHGFYHFAEPAQSSAPIQARLFLDAIGPLHSGEVLALDVEVDHPDLVNWCRSFVLTVWAVTHTWPVIYLNHDFRTRYDWTPLVDLNCGLWLAHWDNDPNSDENASPWPFVAFKQYSDAGSVSGINGAVDLDVFYGSADQFVKYGFPG